MVRAMNAPAVRRAARRCSLIAVSALVACASHDVRRGARFDDLPAAGEDVAVRVVTPADGAYGGKPAVGSGALVAAAIERVANASYRDVGTGPAGAGAARTLEVTPRLLHWEDRATNWSGLLDRVEVELRLRDLPSKRERTLVFEARNGWLTFVNNPPEALLDASFEAALQELLPAKPGR